MLIVLTLMILFDCARRLGVNAAAVLARPIGRNAIVTQIREERQKLIGAALTFMLHQGHASAAGGLRPPMEYIDSLSEIPACKKMSSKNRMLMSFTMSTKTPMCFSSRLLSEFMCWFKIMSNAVARKLSAIQKKGAMKSVDVANLLNARPETVSRWNQGKAFPRPDAEKSLLQLEYIIDQLSDFYEPRDARLWLYSPQRMLNNKSPAELIQAGQSNEVLKIVNQLRDGIFA